MKLRKKKTSFARAITDGPTLRIEPFQFRAKATVKILNIDGQKVTLQFEDGSKLTMWNGDKLQLNLTMRSG